MSHHTILPLAILSMLLSPLSVCSYAQNQTKDEQQKEATFEGKTVSEWVENLKSAKTPTERTTSALALVRIGPAANHAVPALIEALKDKDFDVRNSATFVLGRIGPAPIPALIGALKDEDVLVRRLAADALGRIGPAANDAVPALIGALKDEDEFARSLSALALGDIGSEAEDAVTALKAISENDSDDRLIKAAVEALKKIQGK